MIASAQPLLTNAILQSVAESYLELVNPNDGVPYSNGVFPFARVVTDGNRNPAKNENGIGATGLTAT